MLLPPSMQDKTEFMPLGKAIQKPEPVKADPVRDFERHNHDIPGAPKLPRVTQEMAARALGSLYPNELKAPMKICGAAGEGKAAVYGLMDLLDGLLEPGEDIRIDFHSKPEPLTWPTLPDIPEPTFLPEVVNEAPSRDTEPLGDLAEKIKEVEERGRVGSMVLEVQRRLDIFGFARVNATDMDSMREWFGPLGIPNNWLGKISYSSDFQRMSSGCPSDQP